MRPYTNTYGDINAAFYRSMETMFERAARLITTRHLNDQFQERCRRIVTATGHIGWGFPYTLGEIYAEYFALDPSTQTIRRRRQWPPSK